MYVLFICGKFRYNDIWRCLINNDNAKTDYKAIGGELAKEIKSPK